MAQNKLPRFLLRDCMLWADGDLKIGQIGDITLPVPTVKTEEVRNAGMGMPISVNLGYEALEFSFNMPGFDPQVLALFGLKPGVETPFLITGATVDEDGTHHEAHLTIRGTLTAADAGSWESGEMAENGYTVKVRYYKLEIDGIEIYEIDPFTQRILGVDQRAGINRALLID